MTNANELRIGNWVKLNDQEDGKLVKFKYFSENLRVAFFYKEVMGEFTANIAGIELSPEILEKCGFKKSLNGYCYGMITNDGKNRFSIFPDGTFKLGTQDLSVNIHHLHQLQNLYFALTCEELTFKP